MDFIEEILEFFVDSATGLMGSNKVPRVIRMVIMLISTIILVGCIVFMVSCLIKAVDTIIRIILAILSLAIVFIIIKGWIKVFRR